MILPILIPKMTDSYPIDYLTHHLNASGSLKTNFSNMNKFPPLPLSMILLPISLKSSLFNMVPNDLQDLASVQIFKLHLIFPHSDFSEPILKRFLENTNLSPASGFTRYFLCLDNSFTSPHPSIYSLHSANINSFINIQFKYYTHLLSNIT